MNEERILRFSLVISFFIHTSIIVRIGVWFPLKLKDKSKKEEVQIVYSEIKKNNVLRGKIVKLDKFKPKLKSPPPYIENRKDFLKEAFKKESKVKVVPPAIKDIKSVLIKDEMNSIKLRLPSPSYMEYYKLIREKIRLKAYQNYNLTEEGSVYLTFAVDSSGNILEVKVLDDKSLASYQLKEIAFLSIKEASPFPPFPKELNFPLLTFNILITFQYRD